jgi:hypothetical protein
LAEGGAGVKSPVRVLEAAFWVAASLFVASLAFSDFAAGLFGDRSLRVVNAVLLGAVVICSGVVAWYEFRLNPMADTERGEWTGRQLFYGLVFTITFFIAFIFIPTVIF